MCNKCTKEIAEAIPQKGRPLDTLAQLDTEIRKGIDNEEFSDLESFAENKAVLTKRAKRNCIKNALALGLVSVNEKQREERLSFAKSSLDVIKADNKDKDILRSYWNMWYCSSTLVRKNGKVTGQYCKNRLCLVCNSIRAAVCIKNYTPVFDEWGDDAYFVTLTAPTVVEGELHERVEEMHEIFVQIKKMLKSRYQRNASEKFEGVRKLECTYNPFTNKFHPHFHFMVKGEKNAKLLYNEWLKRTKHLGTSYKAQDCRKADKGSAMEVFKYFTKIVSSKSNDKAVYLKALDVIFKEFRGRRVIQNFGFFLPKEEPKKEVVKTLKDEKIESIEDLQRFLLNQERTDYVSTEELIKKIEGKPCFAELLDWVLEEERRGLPFLEIGIISDLLEEMRSDLEVKEEVFKWHEEDWINEDTGELLTGHKKTKHIENIIKRFLPIYRAEMKNLKNAKKIGETGFK